MTARGTRNCFYISNLYVYAEKKYQKQKWWLPGQGKSNYTEVERIF